MQTKQYFLLFIFFFCTAFGQKDESAVNAASGNVVQTDTSGNNINLDSLVAQQIAIAQTKKWGVVSETEKPKVETVAAKIIPEVKKANWIENILTVINFNDAVTVKIGIILFAVFFASAFITVRRLKLKRKSSAKQNKGGLKSNIQSVRSEMPITKKDVQLKAIRENLQNSSITIGAAEGSLAKKARELKIAKGELMLAAKIKSYELSVCSNER